MGRSVCATRCFWYTDRNWQ